MTPQWFWRELYGGETGRDVRIIQRLLLVPAASGMYDEDTKAYVRGVQAYGQLPLSGIVDSATAVLIGESVESDLPPEWYHRPLQVGYRGDDVKTLHELMHLPFGDTFTEETRKAVLRFQSANHLPLTGKVKRTMANML
jgi:peptidoglycan hydrolase-like protein with peptidoglycan-binding domain